MLLADLLKEFQFDMQCKRRTKRTIKVALNTAKAFFHYTGAVDLEEVTQLHIKKYIAYLQGLGRTATYINSIVKYLKVFYRYCEQEEYITAKQNPASRINLLKEPRVLIETFTDDEAVRMLKQWDFKTFYNARNKAIVAILFETGIRNLELCSLSIADVRETVILVHGKGDKERYVSISPALKKTLIKYERIRAEYIKNKFLSDDAYFCSRSGKRITTNSVGRMIKITGEMAKIREEIRCSPHTIRHYYAQFMLRNGFDVYATSRLLGHENITTTKRYLQSLKDEEIVSMSIEKSPLMCLGRRK